MIKEIICYIAKQNGSGKDYQADLYQSQHKIIKYSLASTVIKKAMLEFNESDYYFYKRSVEDRNRLLEYSSNMKALHELKVFLNYSKLDLVEFHKSIDNISLLIPDLRYYYELDFIYRFCEDFGIPLKLIEVIKPNRDTGKDFLDIEDSKLSVFNSRLLAEINYSSIINKF